MSRKAGEVFTKAEKHAAARDRIAASPERTAERLSSGFDRDAYDFSKYSDADIVKAFQGGTFGDEDYARLTGGKSGGGKDPVDETPSTPTPEPTTPTYGDVTIGESEPTQPITPYNPPSLPAGGGMSQHVNQDNDINSVVQGNNNVVTNTQDNSVSQYGGNYSFMGGITPRPTPGPKKPKEVTAAGSFAADWIRSNFNFA